MELKDFVPPVVIKLVKRIEIRERRNKELRDKTEYESYAHALAACDNDAYENDKLCQMIAAKTIAYRRKLEMRPYVLNASSAFLLSIVHNYLFEFKTGKLSVVDFGGACGAHYFEIRRLIPSEISLDWQVVETPAMAAAARASNLSNSELHFTESLDSVNNSCDLLHSSGALQYVPEPYAYLERLAGLNAKYLFFNRMMFSVGDKDIITVQRSNLSANGPGPIPVGYADREITYPHTTLSLSQFQNRLGTRYRLIWDINESSGTFALGEHKIVGKGFLFAQTSRNGIQQNLPAALASVP